MSMRHQIRNIVLTLCVLTCAARAATVHVATNGNDSASGVDWDNALRTISNAVHKASAGDVVLVSNGVYVVTSQIFINKDITVRSLNGRDVTIVDGNYPATTNRVFALHTRGVVDGFTITNGSSASEGGGVWLYNGGTVQNCVISGNRATNDHGGGGVWMNAGVLSNCIVHGNTTRRFGSGVYIHVGGTVVDCEITENTATERGGAVYFGGAGVVRDTLIADNFSENFGGGVNFWTGSGGVVSNCVISGNICNGNGGGVYFYGSGPWLVRDCLIISNTAASGGGVAVNGGTGQRIENCRILDNTATTGQGGGVYAGNSAYPLFRNCLIAGNRALSNHGGGVCVGPATIQNSTIVSNTARLDGGYIGGGIRISQTRPVIQNTIIYHNRAGAANASNYGIYIHPATFSNCCFAPALGGSSVDYSSDNIISDPMLSFAGEHDYRLLNRSPCINAGRYDSWMDNEVDLDNMPRLDWIYGIPDIGAYEYVPPPKGMMIMSH